MLSRSFSRITWRVTSRQLEAAGVRRCWQPYSTTAEPLIQPIKIINQPIGTQFLISERAANRLAEIYKTGNEVLKISVESGGCHGFQYNMRLVPENNVMDLKEVHEQLTESKECTDNLIERESSDDFEDDFEKSKDVIFVLPEGHGKVVIDEDSLKVLNKTMLTYSTELIGSTFKISGGNMKSSCGCGSSFDIETEK